MMNRWPPSIANRIKVVDISENFMKAKMVKPKLAKVKKKKTVLQAGFEPYVPKKKKK